MDWLEAEVERIYWPCVKTTLVDATGVGSAVMDQMRRVTSLAKGTRLLAVHITGGLHTGYSNGKNEMNVSRTEVMSALRAAVENKAFIVNPKQIRTRDVDTLREELKRISTQSTDKPSETDQDDLAFALALSVWWAKPQSALAFQLPWHSIPHPKAA